MVRNAASRDPLLGPDPMSLTSLAYAPVRIFLFKREHRDPFHVRLAIRMSLPRSEIRTLDTSESGVRTACAIARSGDYMPSMILLEGDGAEEETGVAISLIRDRQDLRSIPIAV